MGQVWLARNLATGAEVAAKILLPQRSAASDAIERFRREAHATAALSHRAIVRAFDLVELDPQKGSLLLVMERLRGHTLAERLEHLGRLGVGETLEVALPILSALDHAHAAGVVHRDLKPENVFLSAEPDGQVLPKLVDFGISKMRSASTAITRQGALVGTPYYMSPEQARGGEVDARSDVFSMGILLYECLSGRPPFTGSSLADVVRAVIEDEAPPLEDVPAPLSAAILRAMSKRPEDRFATAAGLAAALVDACPGARGKLGSIPLSIPPGPVSLTSVPPAGFQTTLAAPPPPRRARALALALGATAAVAVVALLRFGLAPAPSSGAGVTLRDAATRAQPAPKVLASGRADTLAALATAPSADRVARAHPASPLPPPATASDPPPAPLAVPPSTFARDPGF